RPVPATGVRGPWGAPPPSTPPAGRTAAPPEGGGRVNVTPGENSEVLKTLTAPACADGSAVRFVAVAVMIWPGCTFTFNVMANEAVPLPLVVTLVAPRKVWPSAGCPSGSGLLAKNSMRYVTLGEAVSEPVIRKPLATWVTAVRMGKFWKLLGSLAAPCPLELLAVKPSSLGKVKPLVRSMPRSGVGADDAVAKLRPFMKTELPRMLLPLFWSGVALLG